MVQVFDVPSYFVTLRESLEAALVTGIVLAYLKKTGNERFNRWVWAGVALAVLISIGVGIAFGVIFHRTGENDFAKGEKIFEGVTFLVAAGLLSWMVIWMFNVGKSLRTDVESAVERSLNSRAGGWRIFALVFFQILREGIETVILILGVNSDSTSWRSVILPGILGIGTGILLAILMFKGLVQLNLQTFFIVTSIILIAFAAGITSHAFHELQEVDLFSPYTEGNRARAWFDATMWSTKGCCNDKTNEFFAMLRALFGYQDTPTFIEWSTYFAYWFLILSVMVFIYRDAIVKIRNGTARYMRFSSGMLWLSAFVGFIYACGNANWISLTVTIFFLILATASVLGSYDAFTRISAIAGARKKIMVAVGVGSFLLGAYVFALTIAQLSCIGEQGHPINSPGDTCNLPNFFYWGLIFSEGWIIAKPTDTASHALAVLSWSWAVSLFVFTIHGLFALLFAMHTHPTTGEFAYESKQSGDLEESAKLVDEDHVSSSGDSPDDMVPDEIVQESQA